MISKESARAEPLRGRSVPLTSTFAAGSLTPGRLSPWHSGRRAHYFTRAPGSVFQAITDLASVRAAAPAATPRTLGYGQGEPLHVEAEPVGDRSCITATGDPQLGEDP
jgi:hypothetical protein